MRSCCLFGISTCFQVVSQAKGQVAHVLLTHPPLALLTSYRSIPSKLLARLACIRHAASVRPEPGSNSHFLNVCLNVCSFVPRFASRIYLLAKLTSLFCFGFFKPAHFCENIVQFSRYYLLSSLKQLFHFARFNCFCQALFSDLLSPPYLTAFIILLNLLLFVNWFCSIFLSPLGSSCLAAHCPTTVINTSNYFSFWQVFFDIFSYSVNKPLCI